VPESLRKTEPIWEGAESIDTSTAHKPHGLFTVLGAVAELERSLICERVAVVRE